jgi:hypothetical protein
MDKFFTWEMLGTYAGAVIATTLLVQFLKGTFAKLPTQIFSYIVAFVVLLAANFFMKTLTVEVGALCVLNAVLVSLAANGAYAASVKVKSTIDAKGE